MENINIIYIRTLITVFSTLVACTLYYVANTHAQLTQNKRRDIEQYYACRVN